MPPKVTMQLDIMFEHAFYGYFIPPKGSFLIFSGVNLLFFIVPSRSDPKVNRFTTNISNRQDAVLFWII